jgi:hypothetical protein
LSGHRVVVFSADVLNEAAAGAEVVEGEGRVHVAVCLACPWRGGVRYRAQTAVDERYGHMRATAVD